MEWSMTMTGMLDQHPSPALLSQLNNKVIRGVMQLPIHVAALNLMQGSLAHSFRSSSTIMVTPEAADAAKKFSAATTCKRVQTNDRVAVGNKLQISWRWWRRFTFTYTVSGDRSNSGDPVVVLYGPLSWQQRVQVQKGWWDRPHTLQGRGCSEKTVYMSRQMVNCFFMVNNILYWAVPCWRKNTNPRIMSKIRDN